MMKKLVVFGSIIAPLLTPIQVLAIDINITAPKEGYSDLGDFVTKTLQFSFIIAVLVVLAMLIWGAFEWITSGGDKDAVGKARGRIINALIGLAVLAVAFALFTVAGSFLGFDTAKLTIPSPKPI